MLPSSASPASWPSTASASCSPPRSSGSVEALPAWLAALIVTVVVLAGAGVAALLGKKEVAEVAPVAPEKAVAGVKEDVATLKGGSNHE